MIDSKKLLADLRRLMRQLEGDIREQAESDDARTRLQTEWTSAQDAGRTGQTFADWRDAEVTQSAAHWILGCVFLRFVEDNALVDRPWLAGLGERMALARDRYEAYFSANPVHSDHDYLEHAFAEAEKLPGMADLFDRRHNPLWRLPLSGDGARALLNFWRAVDPDSGGLLRDFTDRSLETRFLGDLYQDLSDAAKKRYALLQTPVFIEEFILDRTLTPAIDEFGFREVTLIDPACGSGHFLLGAFARLFDLWARNEPGLNARAAAQRALEAVNGVDLNPFAVAIARFRMLIAALQAAGITRLADAPDFRVNVACGDSLLHGRHFGHLGLDLTEVQRNPLLRHSFAEEDLAQLNSILGRQYHVVVGNPPYITPKDRALNQAYRDFYASCHRGYALSVPFIERLYDLACDGRLNSGAVGYVGFIVSNSFMKREFGKKLIEEVLPQFDLTHLIDTSGAYIPGHPTPTAILLGRNRAPVDNTVRTVMGIRGEPSRPIDPSNGVVWTAIVEQVDISGSESEFVSVEDYARDALTQHPWSLRGGGAAEFHRQIEAQACSELVGKISSIGFYQDTHADEAFVQSSRFFARQGSMQYTKPQIRGEDIRDWNAISDEGIFFPYSDEFVQWPNFPEDSRLWWIWALRTTLWARSTFGGETYRLEGRPWFDYHQFPVERARTARCITFAFVATHNHFVFDRGGNVFNRSAPVIKLPPGASDDDHLALIGLLNCSLACFWMKQVFMDKGNGGIGGGIGDELWERRFEHDGTKLRRFPLSETYPIVLARKLETLAKSFFAHHPFADCSDSVPTRVHLDETRLSAKVARAKMIAVQEELDWHCYRLYGLVEEFIEHPDPPPLALGERAFEIAMARQVAADQLKTTWFSRHRSTPITKLPNHWPDDYRALVEKRLALIESDRFIRLVEKPEYKRRWSIDPWEDMEARALSDWLLDRLEDERYWGHGELISTNRLADLARADADFMAVAELYTGRTDFDPAQMVADLVEAESVPYLPVLRYSESGLRKRAEWERTWALQREEDRIDAKVEATFELPRDLDEEAVALLIAQEQRQRKREAVGDIPVPPKYRTADFRRIDFWRLRGQLDVPKERFVSYPFAERSADGSLVVAWAGWDHRKQAQALAAYYTEMRDNEGWAPERLSALLAGLLELIPWLKQWHNEMDPEYGLRMGDFFEGFVRDEAQKLGFTIEAVRDWTPPAQATRRRRTLRTRTAESEAAE